ncbi:MAG TPA: phosphatase PAP2 family protein [bacterium]|nr:phosphatase PAP2 family protein [bacterium]HPJ71326.1 phosphatase PAP2 family protein [bacterium]HPQ65657.1 phosphatase PAP2 family protein [bacterium]
MKPSEYTRYAEAAMTGYLVYLFLFILYFHERIPGWLPLEGAVTSALAFLAATVLLQERFPGSGVLRTVRNWLPLPLVLFGYHMVHFLVNSDRNPGFLVDRDGWLIAADRFLFGTDPTVWLQRITVPGLTEFMQIVYATNYFLPVVLLLVLFLQRRRLAFQHAVWVIALGYVLSYLGYFAVPAVGPRFTVVHDVPLCGIWCRERLASAIYFMEACPRDCFPSGHTEIPLVTLWLAFRWFRPLARAYLPVVMLLICSTVYLRYHYVVDVLAGMALAGLVILAGRLTLPRAGLETEAGGEA